MSLRARVLIALSGAAVLAVAAVLYVGLATARSRDAAAAGVAGSVSLSPGPRLLVRSTADADRGHLVTVSAADPGGPRAVSPVSCSRVYAAGGTGLCLRPEAGLTTYQLVVFDAGLTSQREIPLVGLPNRARVSASGRMLAWTVFVTGDSYNGGMFSTRAGILDTATGTLAGTLEDFAIILDGKPYQAAERELLGRHVRAGRQSLLRDDVHRGPPLPRSGRLRGANRADAAGKRRVPVIVPRRHAGGVQVRDRRRPGEGLAAVHPGPRVRGGHVAWPKPAASTTRRRGSTLPP